MDAIFAFRKPRRQACLLGVLNSFEWRWSLKRNGGNDAGVISIKKAGKTPGLFYVSMLVRINNDHASLRACVISIMACLPSPNNIKVLSLANRGLGSPAKPGLNERLTTTTVLALSTFRMGMP